MSAEALLERLEKVQARGHQNWVACCPAHEDRNPSLSIRETGDGTTLIKCFAGCDVQSIVEAVGLTLSALFPRTVAHHTKHRASRPRIDGWDVLRALEPHITVIALAAEQTRRGKPLSDEDMETLIQSAAFVKRVKEDVRVVT